MASTTNLFDPLDRRSYSLGATCADSRLIWGSVRRFRSICVRSYFQTCCQKLETSISNPQRGKRTLETVVSKPAEIWKQKIHIARHVFWGRGGVPISAFHICADVRPCLNGNPYKHVSRRPPPTARSSQWIPRSVGEVCSSMFHHLHGQI